MVFTICPKCSKHIYIKENDTMPGCRDFEEVCCPNCGSFLTKVFTSGFPEALVEENA